MKKYFQVKEKTYKFLQRNVKKNKFQGRRLDIANRINENSSYVGKALKELEKEGKIKLLQDHDYVTNQPAIWEVIDSKKENTYDYMEEKDITKVFNELKENMLNKIEIAKNTTQKYKNELTCRDMEIESLKEINNKYRKEIIKLQEQLKNLA